MMLKLSRRLGLLSRERRTKPSRDGSITCWGNKEVVQSVKCRWNKMEKEWSMNLRPKPIRLSGMRFIERDFIWMRKPFGYLAVSNTTKAVLQGTYDYPDDFDLATIELCQEVEAIRSVGQSAPWTGLSPGKY